MSLKQAKDFILNFKLVAHSHYNFSVSKRGNRDLGIILTASSWLLTAFFFVIYEKMPANLLPCCDFTSIFSQFTIFYAFILIFFFCLCISKNLGRYKKKRTLFKHSFECDKIGYVILRAIVANISMYSLVFSRVWNPGVDNSILYITEAMWVWFLLRISGVKINKLSVIGIFIGTASVIYMYSNNVTHGSFGGFAFGIVAGFTLGFITVLTSYLIEYVSARIICFYHALCGLIFSGILAFSFGGREVFANISLSDVISLGISAMTFSISLYSIIRAFQYLENYVIGSMAFLFHVFIESIHYVLTQEIPSLITVIGTLGLLISTLIILITTEAFSNVHHELYSVENENKTKKKR